MSKTNSDPPLRSATVGPGWRALLHLIKEALAERRDRRQRARALRQLRAWDDRRLKDIGLVRSEIRAAVDGRLHRGRRARARPGDAP